VTVPSVPSDRKLVRALHVAEEPGMRKLIVGMLTKDAWDADDVEDEAVADGADTGDLSEANIKAVLRWTFDIDLRD
jgi:hypothetical protein